MDVNMVLMWVLTWDNIGVNIGVNRVLTWC